MGKTFKHYLELLPELRMIIIDNMNSSDRCRFTRCSKLSQKEARKSKNFIFQLNFNISSENRLVIFVMHGLNRDNWRFEGYKLEFIAGWRLKYMTYSHVESDRALWINNLDSSTDMLQLAAEHMEKLFYLYQNTVKTLVLYGKLFETPLKTYDFRRTRLKNLENLHLIDCTASTEFLSRIKKPLKTFLHSETIDKSILNYVYQVENEFHSKKTSLTYGQLLRLSASKISTGKMAPDEIIKFVKSWQNGEVQENFKRCTWCISPWCIKKVLKVFRIECVDIEETPMKIRHKKDSKKFGYLCYSSNEIPPSLHFEVEKIENPESTISSQCIVQ